MSEPSVSIALATYNGAAFLGEQLDSLRAQVLPPLELVVGDDRSDDATLAILARFAETAPFPVRVMVNDHRLHFAENFIRTAARCRGRYVAFCDQDDIWSPHKLRRAVGALEGAQAHLCGHDAWLVDAQGGRIGRHTHMPRSGVFEPLTLPSWGVVFGFATLIRRDLLDVLPPESRGPDPLDPCHALAHDRWAYFLGTTLGRTVYIAEPLADYRQHGANTFGAATGHASLARMRDLMLVSPHDLARHLEACERRAALLAVARPGSGVSMDSLRAGASHWQRLTALYRLRMALALDPSRLARARLLTRLASLGAYRSRAKGGLGVRAFAKDALATALARRLDGPVGVLAQGVAP